MIEHKIVLHLQCCPGNIACKLRTDYVQIAYRNVPVLARLSLLDIYDLCQVILAAVGNLDQAAYDSCLEEGFIDPLLQGMALHLQGLKLCIICWHVLTIFVLHIQRYSSCLQALPSQQ